MKHMRAAVLLLLVRCSDGRDPHPGLGRVGGSVRDLARDDQATFNVPDKTSPSASTLTVGPFQVHPEDQPFATKGTVTLILKCRDLPTAEDAVGQYPEPIVIKADSTVRVVNVPASEADRAFKKLSANCVVSPDKRVYALPYKTAAAQEGRRLAEEIPYGIPMVLEDVAWWKSKFDSSPPTGSSKVCVVDTGYGNGHEDLPLLNETEDGFNPYDDGEWYIDRNDHGTHCAGTIGALGDNSKGVVGVLPNSIGDKFSFFIGKGLEDDGTGSEVGVMAAVQACVDNGSNVISMSLGGSFSSDTEKQLLYDHYKDDDVLIIAAAGNYGDSSLSYPASYPSVMSVAAVDSNGDKAVFSQYNEQIEMAGPGVSVRSTITSNSGSSFGYASYSGTSMATPHVAGVAALLRMYFPDCKAFQIRNAMLRTGKDKGDTGCDVDYGHGIVQAKAAYEFLEANPCDPDEAFKEPVGGCDEFSCTVDSDCDDGNPGTINTCQSFSCTTSCVNDAGCDDGDPDTIDTCGSDGVCTHECTNADVVVDITTDSYPGETSWEFLQEGVTLGEGSGYTDSNTLHTHHVCAGYGEATFTIFDDADDGICCLYGQGGYVITHNGVEKASGGEFAGLESVSFDIAQSNPPTIGCSADATASNYHPDPDVEVCCEWDDDDVPAALGRGGPPVLISLHGSPSNSTSDEEYNAWCKAHVEQVLSDVACALSIPSSYVALGRGWLRRCRQEWREDGIVVPLTLRRNPWEGAKHACRRLNGQYAAGGSPLWRGNLTKMMRLDGDLPCNIGGSSKSSKSSKSWDATLEMADVGGDGDGNIFPWDE